jgi:hypothetical protein
MKVTNYTAGPRGINLEGGGTQWVEPGETVTIDKDKVVGNLPDFGKPGDTPEATDRIAVLEAENADLKARVAELEGGTTDAPVSLAGKNKAQLLDIATAEGVDVADDATNAQIVEAIEAKRAE